MSQEIIKLPEQNLRKFYENNNGIVSYINNLYDGSINHIFFFERQSHNSFIQKANSTNNYQFPLMKSILKYIRTTDNYGVTFDIKDEQNSNHIIPMHSNNNYPGNPLYCVPIVKSILINDKIYLFYLSNMFNNTSRASGQHYFINCSIMNKNKNINKDNIWFNQISHNISKFYLSIDGYSNYDFVYPAIPFSYGIDCIQYDTNRILIIFYFNSDKARTTNITGSLSSRESFLGSIIYDTITNTFVGEQLKDNNNNNINLGFYNTSTYTVTNNIPVFNYSTSSYIYDINILLKKTPNNSIKIIVPYNNTENGINIGSLYNTPSTINNFTDILLGDINIDNNNNIVIDLKTPNNYLSNNLLKINNKIGNYPENLKKISNNICFDCYYNDDTTLNLVLGSNNTYLNNTNEYLCFLQIKTETNNDYKYQVKNCIYINTNSKKVNKVKIGKNNGNLPFIVFSSDKKIYVTQLDTNGNFINPYYLTNITVSDEINDLVNNFFDINTIVTSNDYVLNNIIYNNPTYTNPYKNEIYIFNELISYVSVSSVTNLSAIDYTSIITQNPFISISFNYTGVFSYFTIKIYNGSTIILNENKTDKSFSYYTNLFSNYTISNLQIHVTPVLSNLVGNTIITNITTPPTISLISPIINNYHYHDISFNLPYSLLNILTSIDIYRYESSSNTPPSNINELSIYTKIKNIPFQNNISILNTLDNNIFLKDNHHYWYKLALNQNILGINAINPSNNYLQISTPSNLIKDPSLNIIFNSSTNIFNIKPIPIDISFCTGFDIIIDTSNNNQNISNTISLLGNTDLSYNYQFNGNTNNANIKIKQKYYNYISDNSFNTIIPCPISPNIINSSINLSNKIISIDWNNIPYAIGYDIYINITETDYYEIISKEEKDFNLNNVTYNLLTSNVTTNSYSLNVSNEQAWYSFKIAARYSNNIISEKSSNHSSTLCMICNQLFISDELKAYKKKIYGNNAGKISRNEQWVRMSKQRYYNKRISFNER